MATTQSSVRSAPAKRPATPAKAAVTKAAAKPAAKAKAPAKPAAARPRKVRGVAPEQRRNYIEMAAYYIAERRGFAAGDPLQDWVQAEAEIDRLLAEGRIGA